MISALGAVTAILGTAMAYMGGRYPQHQQKMETVGGVLLLAGFALLGYALQFVAAGACCTVR